MKLVLGLMMGLLVGSAGAQKTPVVIMVTIDGFPARALEDPRLPMPTLRALAAAGAVAKAMIPINPTVTWPNHTALVSGVNASEHHVMANGQVQLPADGGALKVGQWIPKKTWVNARTLYEAAAEKGMTTAQVDWVAVTDAGITWEFAEKPDVNGVVPREMIADGIVTRDEVEHFGGRSSAAWRDEMWTAAAVEIIRKHQPNLLMFHLLATDTVQHQYGPMSTAAYSAYAYADDCLAKVVQAVKDAGIADRTTYFILSDHGFANSTHTISPNVGLAEMGLMKDGKSDVWAKGEGGVAYLYVKRERRAELVGKLKTYFSGVEGVDRVYTNEEQRALGLPAEGETDQAPQVLLTAKAGYAFGDATTGPLVLQKDVGGEHGYMNTVPEMKALFVASGAGVKSGVRLGEVSNLRVAPTVAKVLGVSLPEAKAGVLVEILK